MSTIYPARLINSEYNEDSNYVRIYTQTYYVDATPDAREIDIKQAENVPRIGQSHPRDSYAIVNSINASTDHTTGVKVDGISCKKWDVVVSYTSNSTSTIDAITGNPKDPWKLGAYNYVEETKAYTKLLDRAYKLNSTGDVIGYVPIISTMGTPINVETTVNNIVIRFTYDVLTFKPGWTFKYTGTINKNATNIAGVTHEKGKSRINKLSKKARIDQDGTNYWSVDVEIEYASAVPVGYVSTLNADYKFKNTEGGTTVTRPIQLKDGVYGFFNDASLNVTEPVPISATNTIIDLIENPDDAYYLEFNTARPVPWDVLGFPKEIEERN